MSLKPPNQIVMGKNMGQALVRLSIAFFAHFYTGKHANNRRNGALTTKRHIFILVAEQECWHRTSIPLPANVADDVIY
jgi:hypothetical protein